MKKNVSKELEYYMKLPYTVEIVPYKDGGFFAKIKELEGCMTEADTLEEVLKLLEDAKRAWIETALEEGLDIPLPESMREEKEYSGRILLRLPKSLHRKLAEAAKEEGVSLNTYIINLLSARSAEKELLKLLTKQTKQNFSQPVGV
ncbi:type II toxin-antitoxin system HicB family antitoxin [Phorcysia thermohydrogeniphila]|uniref:Putative RNase H-like HicB family nuclease n=1 Tax=Phorcysia thermohydrogeniphila TaxID=936138 RepID=A0A4R1GEM0_9BACT|nr:type II toxin-antitoxin system HicB family antitoxin [Phorcysia thermohydrogeniphila]TCK05261.1 putative RNase H-like HicB family nuclease [Phorcysia thermohydrogeniphila]